VWDPDTGEQIALLAMQSGQVETVAALPRPDGDHDVVVADGGGRTVWLPGPLEPPTLAGDRDPRVLTANAGRAGALVVLGRPDGGHWIATDGQDERVLLWDAQSGQPAGPLASERPLLAVPAAGGRNLLLAVRTIRVGEPDGPYHDALAKMSLWDVDAGTEVGALHDDDSDVSTTMAALLPMPDGRFRIVIVTGGAVRIWDPETGRPAVELTLSVGDIEDLAVLPLADGRHLLVTAGPGRAVRLWDPGTGEQVAELNGHTATVTTVAVLPRPDGRHEIVSGGTDRAVLIWTPRHG
jgi:WD40 repeat protein